jgi:hypothetical protein
MDQHANAPEVVSRGSSAHATDPRVIVTRRRRARRVRQHGRRWVAARSRKRMLRTTVVCATVLLLMAVGLYFGLSRQDVARPEEGVLPRPVAARGLA